MLTGLLLCILLLGLLALAAVGLGRHPLAGRVVHGGCLAISLGFAGLALAGLGLGLPEAPLALPIGLPGAGAASLLALDGLSAWFLLLLGVTGACASLYALGAPAGPPRSLPPFPLFLAGMAICLAAADAFTLLLGFELMSLASWALVAADHAEAENRAAARRYLMFAALAGACLVPAFGLLAAGAGGSTSPRSGLRRPRAGGRPRCWPWRWPGRGPRPGWCRCTPGCRWRIRRRRAMSRR
ncbi:hypothetical protein ACFQY5_27215 [Paeniroseomonas aquatica]|uniref:hypothetical protein n=1 Tax=Paeniroseomonas aquatica TaxID=373043 RepID=UPI0036166A8F